MVDLPKPTVWIVQETRKRVNGHWVPAHDTTPAETFGTRQQVLAEGVKPWTPGDVIEEIAQTLSSYDADRDYLLLIGTPIYIAIIFTIAADKAMSDGYDHMRVLYWSRREKKYTEILVPVQPLFPSVEDWSEDDDPA